MATLSIHPIEDALAEMGMETGYHSTDDYGVYSIRNGSREIEILEAVSLDAFNSENVVEAILYGDGNAVQNMTETFEEVESVEDFLKAVAEVMNN